MGDTRRGKGYSDKERLKAASELTHMGWQKPAFRDELYMQIIKQTTANDKEWVTFILSWFKTTFSFF